MQRTKWVDRKFNLDIPPGWMPNVLERLYGTTGRIIELTFGLSEEQASSRAEDKWSIKEHIGHLTDLEELHEGRVDDFIARRELLRAADMNNAKTEKAAHNAATSDQLINDFRNARMRLIRRLQELDDDIQGFQSLHPRLQVMMRPVDMAFFTAEHDDHHLASIREAILLL
jgi:hypothetical protein